MPSASHANKAKIAKRVIEVLEYFDDSHGEATVMDIVRRYGRPQSSTSELLSSLVELGLLHKDPFSRLYSLTPRAALLGTGGQPGIVRDGGLIGLVDRLAAQTGLAVGLFGMVGLRAQIVAWHAASRGSAAAVRGLRGGMQEPVSDSAPGWLLLATVDQPRREGMLRRLNAEAADRRRFAMAEMEARLRLCRDTGHVQGPAGFGSPAQAVAVMVPVEACQHPLALGLVYGAEDPVDPEGLLECLAEAVKPLRDQEEPSCPRLEALPTAA